MRGTEFHAKAASFAALNDDGDATFCHESPQLGVTITPVFNRRGCDYEWEPVLRVGLGVTGYREGTTIVIASIGT